MFNVLQPGCEVRYYAPGFLKNYYVKKKLSFSDNFRGASIALFDFNFCLRSPDMFGANLDKTPGATRIPYRLETV